MNDTIRKLGLALIALPDEDPKSELLEARFIRACKRAGLKPIATLVTLRDEVEGDTVWCSCGQMGCGHEREEGTRRCLNVATTTRALCRECDLFRVKRLTVRR